MVHSVKPAILFLVPDQVRSSMMPAGSAPGNQGFEKSSKNLQIP